MASLFDVFCKNFLTYDFIIFILAAANTAVFFAARKNAKALYGKLHLMIFVPEEAARPSRDISFAPESEVVSLRDRSNRLYGLYLNMTGIFPLLGILGTVISLLPLVADLGNVQADFYGALTSTFWGLVFAIIFKLIDGFVSSVIEDNEKNVALFLDRNGRSF